MAFKLYLALLLACLSITCWHCGGDDRAKAGDKLLAQVYNKNLYLSDLEGIVPEGVSPEDSVLLVRAFTNRWVRDHLLMYEAERNIPKDLDIDKLVRDYRASLVRYNFEEKIIAERLDSTVAEEELKAFYEQNKDQFQLENTILKVQLLKAPNRAPQAELNKLWYDRSNDRYSDRLANFAKQWGALALLDREKWYKLEEVAAFLPKGTLTADNVASRKEGTLSDGDFRYYYRVLEAVQGKETAPFDYVREQAVKIILHRRKQDLLEKWKEELYQKELKRENIKLLN